MLLFLLWGLSLVDKEAMDHLSIVIYVAPLVHDWKNIVDGILRWFAPLVHNIIRWESGCNFEQTQIVTRIRCEYLKFPRFPVITLYGHDVIVVFCYKPWEALTCEVHNFKVRSSLIFNHIKT